jgi:hypothetical protein
LASAFVIALISPAFAFYQSHDIQTHADGSVHLFEKTQHRRLNTNNLKADTNTATKFTVHGSEYITENLHVDGDTTVGGILEFETTSSTLGSLISVKIADIASTGTVVIGAFASGGLVSLDVSTNLIEVSGDGNDNDNDQLTVGQVAGMISGATLSGGSITTALDGNDQLTVAQVAGMISGATLAGGKVITALDGNDQLTVGQVAGMISGATLSGSVITVALDGNDQLTVAQVAGMISGAKVSVSATNVIVTTPGEYRLQKMILLLCNTLGVKYEHLERAVDAATFKHYARFENVHLNFPELYGALAVVGDHKITTTAIGNSLSLCSSDTNGCTGDGTIKHALALCADNPCVPADFVDGGHCCTIEL